MDESQLFPLIFSFKKKIRKNINKKKMSSLSIIPVTEDYKLDVSDVDCVVLADASSNSITITLPDISSPTDGINFRMKRIDTTLLNTVTIVGYDETQLIDGAASLLATKVNPVEIVSYAGQWYVISFS